jgi:membrane protein DedA with SNARE-associated domain
VRDFSIDWFEYFFSSSIDKQVAEKKQRRAREWETKIERDRKYVNRHEIVFVFLQQLFFN